MPVYCPREHSLRDQDGPASRPNALEARVSGAGRQLRADDTPELQSAVVAGPPVKMLLAAVALGTMLAPFNATMLAVALPEISDDLGVGLRDLSWVIVGYLITMAATQPVAGKLGDIFGRRVIFLGAMVAFVAVSIGAALAPNLPTLLVMRVGQALASATAIPNGAALVREWVPEHRRAAAFGIVGASAGLAAGLGPPIGGAMIALGGWRAMFWFNIPIVLLTLVLAWRAFPRDRGHRSTGGFDFRGAALLAGTLTALALTASAVKSGNPWALFGLSTAAVVLGALFIYGERVAASPIIRLSLFRAPAFSAATATILLSNMAMYSTLLVVPLFLVEVQGRGVSQVGVVLAAMSLPVVFLSPLGGRLA
ncbi:MAG: MFS transporter, partial [Dehalococcoidia bacterium]